MTDRSRMDAGRGARAASAFGLWADPVLSLALAALWIALAIVFNGEPGIDRAVSAAFFRPGPCAQAGAEAVCGTFPATASAFLQALRDFLQYLPAVAAVVVAAGLANEVAARRGFASPRVRFAAAALAAYAVGPGLLVNLFLKDHWGRPRPAMTDLFGGSLPFVPAGQWSDACLSNCSFVSGEASAIFWLLCLVPLLPAGWRRAGAVLAAALAVFASGLRIAFGGHYLSDVVLGGLSTLVVFAAIAASLERLVRIRDRP